MGVAVSVRLPFVKRFALLAIPALLANLAVAAGTTVVSAGGSVDALNVRVLGGSLGNITTSPLTLSPTFAQATTDYVLRCHSGINAIQVTLSAASAGKIAVGKDRGSSVTINENLLENQALIISGPGRGGSNDSSASGQSGQSDWAHPSGGAQYWIRCLPSDFPQLSVKKPGSPDPGWYLTGNLNSVAGSGTYAMVLNNNGTPVWYRRSIRPGAANVTLLAKDEIAWNGLGVIQNGAFEVFDLETQSTHWLSVAGIGLDFHELQPLPNGNLILLSSPLRSDVDVTTLGGGSHGTILDCLLLEVAPGGQIVWQWRASDHISVRESTNGYPVQFGSITAYDAFHCNSIDVSPSSDSVLMSARHTDAVYKINKATGTIEWKLGGNSATVDNEKVLAITRDTQGAFHAQHDARFRLNNDISLFDDQTFHSGLAARAVEYHVDAAAGTATLVWSYAAPDGGNSAATGSFQRLSQGNDNVIGWGVKPGTLFSEVDGSGTLILDVGFPSGEVAYRVVKVPSKMLRLDLLRATAGLPPAPLP
jgi:hypothetical protein